MIYAIVCTQAQMGPRDIIKECVPGKWVPLLVMRPAEGLLIVPCFKDSSTACRFAERNMPKEWRRHGKRNMVMIIDIIEPLINSDGTLRITEDKSANITVYTFPQKVNAVFDIEIMEYNKDMEESPVVFRHLGCGGKPT